MNRTNKERILDYLWSIVPDEASNSQIQKATGISSHQQVYMLTRELMGVGWIRGTQREREWAFCANESVYAQFISPGQPSPQLRHSSTGRDHALWGFCDQVWTVMSDHLGVTLESRGVPGVPWRFDLVSPDMDIVGDTLYFAPVQGQRLPLAKYAVISERVWLLERTGATVKFLVFGNDRYVPVLWLDRYGHLVSDVVFYFLSDEDVLERLTGVH